MRTETKTYYIVECCVQGGAWEAYQFLDEPFETISGALYALNLWRACESRRRWRIIEETVTRREVK